MVVNDISWSQIESLNNKYQEVIFTNHNAVSLPLIDKAFDVAYCSNTLHHMPNKKTLINLLKSMEKVAKKLIIVEIENPVIIGGFAQKLNKLGCKFENFKQTDVADKSIEMFLKVVKKLKRMAILGNIGICIGVLGVIAPALMVALRKLDKNNQGFQVKEDLKKQMAFNGKI